MSVHLESPATSPTDATPATVSGSEDVAVTPATPNVVTIDMKSRPESEILRQLMETTGARQVEPNAEELELMRDLQEHNVKAEKDSVRSKAVRAQWKKEQNMLKAAREGN